jgi:hypothetical protein
VGAVSTGRVGAGDSPAQAERSSANLRLVIPSERVVCASRGTWASHAKLRRFAGVNEVEARSRNPERSEGPDRAFGALPNWLERRLALERTRLSAMPKPK